MIGTLVINGKDAFKEYGVRMGDSFIANLFAMPNLKDPVTNTSRTEHGTRVIINGRYFSQRDITLNVTISGETWAKRRDNERKFRDVLLTNDLIDIYVPEVSMEHFKVYCKGGTSYNLSLDGTIVGAAFKFCEPNPGNRI